MPLFFLAALRALLLFCKFRVSLRRAPASPFPPRCRVESRGIFSFPPNDKKAPLTLANQGLIGIRQRLILPGRVQPSTFSTGELNFCVRDGNRWSLSVITTGKGWFSPTTAFYPDSIALSRGDDCIFAASPWKVNSKNNCHSNSKHWFAADGYRPDFWETAIVALDVIPSFPG